MREEDRQSLCFVIPVYDHGPQFVQVWPALRTRGIHTIVVDDGSGAETAALLQELSTNEPLIKLIRHPVNRGKGGAVVTGIREARALGFSHVFQIDADGQHDLTAITAFRKASDDAPNALIVGYPVFDRTVSDARRWGRLLTTVWIWIETLSFTIRDGMCGFRIYPLASVLPILDTRGLGTGMDFDPEFLVRASWAALPIKQLPVKTTYPTDGRSNFRMGPDNLLISWMHTRLFFGALWRLPILLARHLR